jgi:hypothetical protein
MEQPAGIETSRGLGAHSSGLEKNDLLPRFRRAEWVSRNPRGAIKGPTAAVFKEHARRYPQRGRPRNGTGQVAGNPLSRYWQRQTSPPLACVWLTTKCFHHDCTPTLRSDYFPC